MSRGLISFLLVVFAEALGIVVNDQQEIAGEIAQLHPLVLR